MRKIEKLVLISLFFLTLGGSQAEASERTKDAISFHPLGKLTEGLFIAAAEWDKRNGSVAKREAKAGHDSAGPFRTAFQSRHGADVRIASKPMATMHDCPNNWVGSPQDGDVCYDTAIDRLLYFDMSTIEWRCALESQGIVDVFCPPYNADSSRSDGTNHRALQAALDRVKDWSTGEPFRAIYLGEESLRINGTLEFDPQPDTSTILMMYAHGNGGLQFTRPGAYGLKIGGTNTGNVVRLRDITLRGRHTGPDTLLHLDDQVQVWMEGIKIADAKLNGIKITGGGHVSFANGLCTENAVNDVGGACIAASGTVTDLRIVNTMSEGAVNGSNLSLLSLEASSIIGLLHFQGNGHRGNSLESLVKCRNSNCGIKIGNFIGNTASELEHSAFDLRGTAASNKAERLTFVGNVLSGCHDACGTNVAGIGIFDATDVVMIGNVIEDFKKGVILDGTTAQLIANNNIFKDITDVCFDIAGIYSNIDIGGFMCDGAKTADFKATGTSKGNNSVANVVSTDGRPPILNLVGWRHQTDSIKYAPRVQIETCTDNTIDGSPQILTLNPYYEFVKVTNADTDKCDITMGETNGTNGAKFTLLVVADGGRTVDLTGSAGVAELTGAFKGGAWDSITMEYTGTTTPDRWIEIGRRDN